MSDSASQFTGSIPEYYDRCLGPVIFEDYAAELAGMVAAASPTNVLELAAGTGVVTCALQEALPDTAEIIATDLNWVMLEIAESKLIGATNVSFQEVDAMNIPLEDHSVDAAACQFGVMFFPNKIDSYRQVARVLKSGGQYFLSTWDTLDTNPFAAVAHGLITETFGANAPGFYNVPFHYHDEDLIRAELSEAGFVDIEIQTKPLNKTIASVESFAQGLILGNPVSQEIRSLGKEPEDYVGALTERFYVEFGRDPSVMPLSAIFVSART
jgi:ubiquinone/menaquinone biosynthesis C-methylase UbiE